jgi:hypothetical protein
MRVIGILGCTIATLLAASCGDSRSAREPDAGAKVVTVYVSTDRVFWEPVLLPRVRAARRRSRQCGVRHGRDLADQR